MIRAGLQLSPEVGALLERERELPSLPAGVRARALARARAALIAGNLMVLASPPRGPGIRWAVAVALVLACLAGATLGAAASQICARLAPAPGSP